MISKFKNIGIVANDAAFFYKYKKKDNSLIKKMSQIPIGKPFKGLKIKIDHEKQLYISGNIISPGYLDKSKKLDKGKFLKIKGRKFYNTGDVVVKKNNLYFCKGRNDTQIKIKGYRVDTTEIEKLVKKIKDIDYTYCYANNKNNSSYLVLIIITKLNLKKFKIKNIIANKKNYWPQLGVTLDEYKDYLLLKKIINHFDKKKTFFECADIINIVKKKKWIKINKHVKRKGYDKKYLS